MENSIFKQKYQKYKFRVKVWEKDFKKKHGRIPSKYDIRDASKDIRDSYKMYYKLKTSFLEDTLNDVLSDDGFDVFEMSQNIGDISITDSLGDGSQLPIDVSKLVEQQGVSEDPKHGEHCNKISNVEELPVSLELTSLANSNETNNIKEFEPVTFLPLNKSAWGPDMTNKLVIDKKEIRQKSLKPNFKNKLFTNTSFSKRNPRKSFSKLAADNSMRVSQCSSTDSLNASNKEILPDLETILLQKSKEQSYAPILEPNSEKFKDNIKTHVDEGWLERNAVQNDIKPLLKVSKEINKEDRTTHEQSKKSVYGLSKMQIKEYSTSIQKPEILITNAINSNSNLESEKSKFNFNEIPATNFQKDSTTHDSDSVVNDSGGEEDSKEYRHMKRKRVSPLVTHNYQKKKTICNGNKTETDSENEYSVVKKPQRKNKKCSVKKSPAEIKSSEKTVKKQNLRKANRVKCNDKITKSKKTSKKRKIESEEPSEDFENKPLNPEDLKFTLALESGDLTSIPRIKQTDLDRAESLAKKYICSTTQSAGNPTLSKSIPVTAVGEKRASARRKLEEKIAAGKLNENFVTINIQKKAFVRGKKSINYSKYKKKLWKHKKNIAALSGPNMDMGGCDGGTLKCFNCGKAGHFAQNCKIKGDSLLPLTAQLEVDDSPFPTLEEAERMANQSAVSVHSRNIAKLPQAPNVAIYNKLVPDEQTTYEDEVKVTAMGSDVKDKSKNSIEEQNEEQNLMETDEELENFDVDSASLRNQINTSPIKKYIGSKIPEGFLKAAGLDLANSSSPKSFRTVSPMYNLNTDGSVKEVTNEVLETLKMFGHTNFRKGQDRAIMRILSGMSTLVTLSTGSGKSLCYQLPAYLYSKHKKSITLVISPLVSLMEDQVTGVPNFLRAHCLHTNQTPQQKIKIMKMIADGDIDVLLVSPEAVVAGERSTGFGAILKQLPPIAFACIDEAHCVSQWSHNFRPSYLMICKVLKQNLGIKCVLGLTATATLPTRSSIINHLGITDGERGIISDIPLPDNLILSVSKDVNRDSALLQLLLSKRFAACQSIIIYCTRRDECERLAGYLRTCLQDSKANKEGNGKMKRKRVNWNAEPYHAGMVASRRRTIQNAFMSNELRIVVATIAFGMGINKSDIRAVIHYNMPRAFESYVQEVGRAGRDNKTSHCHLFLDGNGNDQNELKRHIYANSLDRHVIRKLLQRIFVPCSCDTNLKDGVFKNSALAKTVAAVGSPEGRHHICKGHEIGFSIEKTVEALDIPEENISTLLCYMELDSRWHINVLSNAYIKAKVISYGGPKYLKYAAKESPPLAMAIAMQIKSGCFKEDANIIEFSVVDIAAAIGWNSGVVKYQLKNLEWVQANGISTRSPITVNFYDLGFRIKAPGDFTVDEIDEALDTLYNRSVKQEHTQLIQLQYIFQGLSSVAYSSHASCCNETFSQDRSDQLKGIIRDYFQNDYPKNLKLEIDPSEISDDELESDVIALINMYPENNFSGRNIARIFHGISSPNYPAVMWYRCKFWRVHSKADFNRIVQLANTVIVRRRT